MLVAVACNRSVFRIFYAVETAAHTALIEALRAENALLRQRAEAAEKAAREAQEKLAQLAHELAQIKRLLFGTKSERFEPAAPDQLALFAGATPVEVPPLVPIGAPSGDGVPAARPQRRPVRQVLPSHLPRETLVIEPETDTRALKKIGVEVSETLDYRPAKLVVIRRERPKYVDPCNEDRGVIIAPLPPRPIEKGMAEPGLLANILVEKYVDHLPLYRQLQRFTRQGITLAGSTLGDWAAASAELLTPLYDELTREARTSGYIQADETPIPVQDPEEKGKTHRGYYWVYHAPLSGLVVVDYEPGRGRDGPTAWLANYRGALQSDGYRVYEDFDEKPGITTYGCWAHARRYFFEALENECEAATYALSEIQKLYEIERALRETDPTPKNRRLVRQEEAAPVLEAFKAWLASNPGLPKSPWGKAVAYSLARWEKLTRYVEDGRIEIDNNLVENAIRPIALGRKNYLFAGSHEAAQRAAIVYSLLATCKKYQVEPQTWLSDVLRRIPSHPQKQVRELLPHVWQHRKV